jgi:hypothetical protein
VLFTALDVVTITKECGKTYRNVLDHTKKGKLKVLRKKFSDILLTLQ